jgi:putative heme transporter
MASADTAAASVAPDVPTHARPTRRQVIGRALLLIGIVLVVFVGVLPRIVDYDAVRAAIAGLTAGQLALIAGLTAFAYVANAGPCRALVEGLSWRRAVGADLAARAVVSTIPGPTDIATKFVLYRQWGIPTETATSGIVFAGFFEPLAALVLPLIAVVAVIITGHSARPNVIWVAIVGMVVLVISALIIAGIVRSESLARRVGNGLDWLAQHLWRIVRKTPPTGIVQGVVDFRERSKDILSRHGLLAFGAAVLAKLAWFLVLEACLWAVGIGPDIVPASVVLAAMAVVAIVSLIPITPGAVGVSEVAYIGLLTAVAGTNATGPITAAVTLFRVAQWLAPILIGWVLLAIMRRGHWGELLGSHEPAVREMPA